MRIIVVDINHAVVSACLSEGLEASQGSIIEAHCDAVVSPANSFGFMDGGVDAVYTRHFGEALEAKVKGAIAGLPFGELLIGQALAFETGARPKWLISAPTMRVPLLIKDANDVRLATRAAVAEAVKVGVNTLAFPGMGTGCGRLDPRISIKAMKTGIADALAPAPRPTNWRDAQSRHYRVDP